MRRRSVGANSNHLNCIILLLFTYAVFHTSLFSYAGVIGIYLPLMYVIYAVNHKGRFCYVVRRCCLSKARCMVSAPSRLMTAGISSVRSTSLRQTMVENAANRNNRPHTVAR